jgi:hypothetical protein
VNKPEKSAMATPQFVPFPNPDEPRSFSPVDNEPPLRWQRKLHLAPSVGLGVVRRALFFAVLGWLPIALWAVSRGRFVQAPVGEPLLQHYGVHVRCLVAIPMLILGEATLDNAAQRYFPQFVSSGLVDDAMRPRFEAVLRAVRRWRDSSLPWVFIIGVAIAWSIVDRSAIRTDAMSWALDETGSIGFGGAWFVYVVRPIFLGLLLAWLWRIALLVMVFVRIGQLRLLLVPSHPDRAAGLGFLERLPEAFTPVGLALSAMLASRWAHEVVYHGGTLDEFKLPAAMFLVLWSLLLLAPLVVWLPPLLAAKRAALPLYAALVAEQGRLVRRRWIDGTLKTDAPLLEPAGVGPIADATAMFDAVRSMRSIPIGKASLAAIALPIAVPMLAVAALQIPIRNLLFGLVKALV